ncbi:MAG: DoxX family protein [Phycisphaerales bacterium]
MGDSKVVCGGVREPGGVGGSLVVLLVRILVGAIFVFSGAAKLGFIENFGDPTGFATAVLKFRVVHPDFVVFTTFFVPWLELIGGGAVLLGAMTRGGGTLIALLLTAFTAAILSIPLRGLEIGDCSCFGGQLKERFPTIGEWLEPDVGWKSVTRNVVLFGLTLIPATWGGGAFSVDHAIRRAFRGSDDAPASTD